MTDLNKISTLELSHMRQSIARKDYPRPITQSDLLKIFAEMANRLAIAPEIIDRIIKLEEVDK